MATKVKPSRIHATWTPQNWQVLSYVSPDTFQWTNWGGGWWWDMYYNNFNWVTKTWSSFDLDLSSKYVPTWNFTVNAPATIKEWQTYLLRVDNWATAYTMTLWNWITNLQWTDITLTPNAIDMFVFLATKDWNEPVKLELQKEINTSSWWWVYSFSLYDETSQTELDNLWSRWDNLPEEAFDDSVIMIDSWNANAGWTYFFNTQDSQDAYFFGATNMLRIQFEMEWWYTRTGIISVTIEPLYTAGTWISISGNVISATGGGWSGDVVWPASSTNWHLAVFDWATWKLIKDGGAIPTEPTVVSGDTGTTYTIKVAHSDPSWVANNVITFVTPLLEYSELIALNNADAILRELNTDALWYFQKFLDEWLIGEQLGPGDTSEETTIIYYYLMNSPEWDMRVVDGKGFIREDWAEVWNFIDYN